jgi:hypothetical protein
MRRTAGSASATWSRQPGTHTSAIILEARRKALSWRCGSPWSRASDGNSTPARFTVINISDCTDRLNAQK